MLLSPAALAQHAPQLPLEQLCMDVPSATQAPLAALAALPSLRCLELTLPPLPAGAGPAMAHMAEALLPVVLAPPALSCLLLHCIDLAQLQQSSQGWAELLERLAQERPRLEVCCTGPKCQCAGCRWRQVLPSLTTFERSSCPPVLWRAGLELQVFHSMRSDPSCSSLQSNSPCNFFLQACVMLSTPSLS